MKNPLTAVSLFSGCGGFDWGATQAGVKIIFANDCDSVASTTYRNLFPDVTFHEGDISEIEQFPRADILIGCYPCTGFSEAAKRKKPHTKQARDLHANENNYLFLEFRRALRQVQPKFIFVENVRGMLTAADGWFLKRQLAGFRRWGYKVKYQLLQSECYGVPQKRRRVFIVGVHSSVKDFTYEFPVPTHGPGSGNDFVTLRDTLERLGSSSDDDHWKKEFHGHYLTRPRKQQWDEPSYTIVAHPSHVPLHPSGELMVAAGKDKYELRGVVNRRLSWRECAAIQSLPEHISVSGSLANKYRVVGNAVPPPVAKALLQPLMAFVQRSKSQ